MSHNKVRRGRMNFGFPTQRRGCVWPVMIDPLQPKLGVRPCAAVRVKHQLCGLHEKARAEHAARAHGAASVYYKNPTRRAKHAIMNELNLSGRQWARLRKAEQRHQRAAANLDKLAAHPGWNPLLRLAASLRQSLAKAA